jgi:glycine cleavage system H protein
MSQEPQPTLSYKRARFSTRLPVDRRYSPSHYWLAEDAAGVYRVGMTKFATRMLGDFVELHWAVSVGDEIEIGEPIGTIEGFKAVSDVYSAVSGRFAGGNADLAANPELLQREPYAKGWLYQVEQGRVADVLDVHGYVGLLDATIDRMLAEQQKSEGTAC